MTVEFGSDMLGGLTPRSVSTQERDRLTEALKRYVADALSTPPSVCVICDHTNNSPESIERLELNVTII